MPEELFNKFDAGMQRILKQEPMAHVLGYSWFYGYKMISSPDALIPRVETEELCAQILSRIDEFFVEGRIEVVDVGTGSGAIAITLAKEESRINMKASECCNRLISWLVRRRVWRWNAGTWRLLT